MAIDPETIETHPPTRALSIARKTWLIGPHPKRTGWYRHAVGKPTPCVRRHVVQFRPLATYRTRGTTLAREKGRFRYRSRAGIARRAAACARFGCVRPNPDTFGTLLVHSTRYRSITTGSGSNPMPGVVGTSTCQG